MSRLQIPNVKQFGALLLAILMLLTVFAGVPAMVVAEETEDNEIVIAAADTVVYDADVEASTVISTTTPADSENLVVFLRNSEDDILHEFSEYTFATDEVTVEFGLEDVLGHYPMGANTSESLAFEVYEGTDVEDGEPVDAATAIGDLSFTFEQPADRSVVALDEQSYTDRVASFSSDAVLSIPVLDYEFRPFDVSEHRSHVNVSEEDHQHVVVLADSDADDAWDAAADGLDDGDWIIGAQAIITDDDGDRTLLKVYNNEAGDDETGAHAVYDGDAVTVDFDDETGEYDVDLIGGSGYSFNDVRSAFGFADALSTLNPLN